MFRKIAMFSIVLFILSVISVYAQPGGQRMTPEERMKATIKTLTEKLTLTPDQVKKVTDLYTKNNEEMTKVRESLQGDRTAMMEAMQKNRGELNKKIDALLDAKQKEAFIKYNKDLDAERANRQRPPQQ
jgi:Spy/CpxP family protein refolding chaperone